MAQMEGKQEHSENVKPGNERALEAKDHHRIDVVMVERIHRQIQKSRVGAAKGEMEQVIDDENEQDEPAHHHGAGGERRLHDVLAAVTFRPGAAVLDREPDRVINVEDDDEEQNAADDPEERPKFPEMLGVAVNPLRPEENLEVAEEMADDEQNQDYPSHRHDYFPANG